MSQKPTYHYYAFDQAMSEIDAFLSGREYQKTTGALAGWSQWSYEALLEANPEQVKSEIVPHFYGDMTKD